VKQLNCRDLSRSRRVIYGAAALMVMLGHMGTRIEYVGWLRPLRILQKLGGGSVEIFLLLGAVGLYHSLGKGGRLRDFYLRRALRVLPPLIVCGLVFDGAIYHLLPYGSDGRPFLIYWLMSSAVWYVSFIALMYLLSPLIFALQKRNAAALWLAVPVFAALSFLLEGMADGPDYMAMRMISRFPVFLLGCALAPHLAGDRPLPRWLLPLMIPCTAGAVWFWVKHPQPELRYSYRMIVSLLVAVSIILLISFALRYLEKCAPGRLLCRGLGFCGDCSLEIYLLFARVRAMLELLPIPSVLGKDLIAAVLSIPLAHSLADMCAKLVHSHMKFSKPGAAS